ncbi:MAG: substrate binding domain-containing protein [Myxococcales bacterium]
MTRFAARYPQVRVEMLASPGYQDLVREGLDLALRIAMKPLAESSPVVRKVGVVAVCLYASPLYLARHGVPRSEAEMADHDLIAFQGTPSWLGRNGRSALAKRVPRIECNDMFFAREVLRGGAGVGALPTFIAEQDLESGSLVRVLPRWSVQVGSVYLVHAGKKHVPSRVTAFRGLLLETLERRPLSPPADARAR